MVHTHGSNAVQLVSGDIIVVVGGEWGGATEGAFTRGRRGITFGVCERGELRGMRCVAAGFVGKTEEEIAPGEDHGPAEEEDEDFDADELLIVSVLFLRVGKGTRLTDARIKLVTNVACGTVKSWTYFRHSSLSWPLDSVWQIIHTFTGLILCGSLNTFPNFESCVQNTTKNARDPTIVKIQTRMLRHCRINNFRTVLHVSSF